MRPTRTFGLRLLGAALIASMILLAACSPQATPTQASPTAMGTGGAEQEVTIPNNGAVIRIVSPRDGDPVNGNEITVKVEVENFKLGDSGNHWHVILDGEEVGTVEGGGTEYTLHGVAAGQHEIEATLATGNHEELEDGAKVTVTVNG